MLEITGTDDWRAAHPGAVIGLLEVSGVENDQPAPQLDAVKRQVEARLRHDYAAFTRRDFLALPVMAGYQGYYKAFDKNYHVLLQVESIALKDKRLPDVSPLVDANFTAEVDTLVLTAGHDVDRLQAPVWIDVSRPGDEIIQMNGAVKAVRPGDMVMRDALGLCCTILYGQDNRSPITAATRRALYVAYAPAGAPAAAVEVHLRRVEANVRLFAPRVTVEQLTLLRA